MLANVVQVFQKEYNAPACAVNLGGIEVLYSGDWDTLRDHPHGAGIQYHHNGQKAYEGSWSDGVHHGPGRTYNQEGALVYQGSFVKGERDGYGVLYHHNEVVQYEGSWASGWRQGNGTEYDKHGSVVYSGCWTFDTYHGEGERRQPTFSAGKFYYGEPENEVTCDESDCHGESFDAETETQSVLVKSPGELVVEGKTQLEDQVVVKKQANFLDAVTITGAASIGGNLAIAGSLTVNGQPVAPGGLATTTPIFDYIRVGDFQHIEPNFYMFNSGMICSRDDFRMKLFSETENGRRSVDISASASHSGLVFSAQKLPLSISADTGTLLFKQKLHVVSEADVDIKSSNLNIESYYVDLKGLHLNVQYQRYVTYNVGQQIQLTSPNIHLNGDLFLQKNITAQSLIFSQSDSGGSIDFFTVLGTSRFRNRMVVDLSPLYGSQETVPNIMALQVIGNTSLENKLSVAGASTLSSTLQVAGASTLSSTLQVAGASTLSGTLNVSGASTLSSTLQVAGASTLSGTLNVSGASDFGSNVSMNSNKITNVASGTNPHDAVNFGQLSSYRRVRAYMFYFGNYPFTGNASIVPGSDFSRLIEEDFAPTSIQYVSHSNTVDNSQAYFFQFRCKNPFLGKQLTLDAQMYTNESNSANYIFQFDAGTSHMFSAPTYDKIKNEVSFNFIYQQQQKSTGQNITYVIRATETSAPIP